MSEKVNGNVLLILGLIIMVIAFYGVYSVFTKKSEPYTLFNLPGISLDLSNFIGSDLSSEESMLLKKQSGPLSAEIIDAEIINKPLNLAAYLLFMGFVLNVGYKIASLGVQFLRPVKVNLKTEKEGD